MSKQNTIYNYLELFFQKSAVKLTVFLVLQCYGAMAGGGGGRNDWHWLLHEQHASR